jgi:hypothetical protein
MNRSTIRTAFVLSFLALAPALVAGVVPSQPDPRRPRGIYGKVKITEYINQSHTAADLHSLYQDLLNNPAISGLALQIQWDTLNPYSPTNTTGQNPYDWSYLEDAFTLATAAKKTIQLIVTPGFQSPSWVLDQLDSCDGTFPAPPKTCGKVTFAGFTEPTGGKVILPLPWDPTYKTAWQTFLTALAVQYGSTPALVSISVAGPTAESEEMILPSDTNSDVPQSGSGLHPNQMWMDLLASKYGSVSAGVYPGFTYQNSDQAFIDEWNNAIDMYGKLFSNLTLVVTTGSGLPNLSKKTGFPPPDDFKMDCGRTDMDCAAETWILSHFADNTVGGANAKATQTSGMKASSDDNPNLGVNAVKDQSGRTAQYSVANQLLGGAQFNSSFSDTTFHTLKEGCTSKFPPDSSGTCSIPSSCTTVDCLPVSCIPQACLAPGITRASLASFTIFSNVPAKYLISPEQAESNVLKGYFDNTAVAVFFGGTMGADPLNYLQIYYQDIQYAAATNALQLLDSSTVLGPGTSAQSVLDLASQKLYEIAEPAAVPPPGQSVPMLIRVQ